MWHTFTCNNQRRDWRIVNLDDPCTCGFVVPGEELCTNLAVLWDKDPLYETEPGFIFSFTPKFLYAFLGSKTWVAHRKTPIDGRYLAFYVSISFNSTTKIHIMVLNDICF